MAEWFKAVDLSVFWHNLYYRKMPGFEPQSWYFLLFLILVL